LTKINTFLPGVLVSLIVAILSINISNILPGNLIGASVLALLIGMAFNPLISRYPFFVNGFTFTSKKVLKFSIVLMGSSLSFVQVIQVGRISLIVMIFTLLTAFGLGYILGKLFNMDWRLTSLLSAGTGICGGSAIAAIAPVINSKDSQIAYAISATFVFDILMVILFPIMGAYFKMSDLGFGLWAGTSVNDTSSVVAAGYAFSDIAGNYAVIVKLTRTLSIVPIVIIFSIVNNIVEKRKNTSIENTKDRLNLTTIFPYFILFFLLVVGIKSSGLISSSLSLKLSTMSKFLMVMSLGAIGLKTDVNKLKGAGPLPMVHGFLISSAVVIVSFIVQSILGQL